MTRRWAMTSDATLDDWRSPKLSVNWSPLPAKLKSFVAVPLAYALGFQKRRKPSETSGIPKSSICWLPLGSFLACRLLLRRTLEVGSRDCRRPLCSVHPLNVSTSGLCLHLNGTCIMHTHKLYAMYYALLLRIYRAFPTVICISTR